MLEESDSQHILSNEIVKVLKMTKMIMITVIAKPPKNNFYFMTQRFILACPFKQLVGLFFCPT